MFTKIKINQITNLTEARYYAAMGVDFLGFRPSQIDIKDIISIIDWVEGTRAIIDIYAEKDIPTTELFDKFQGIHVMGAIDITQPNGLKFKNYTIDQKHHFDSDEIPVFSLLKPFAHLSDDEKSYLEDVTSSSPIWLFSEHRWIEEYIAHFNWEGIVIENTLHEDGTGLMDYDEVNDLFESFEKYKQNE